MTEKEWKNSNNPEKMLEYLLHYGGVHKQHRKLFLFCLAASIKMCYEYPDDIENMCKELELSGDWTEKYCGSYWSAKAWCSMDITGGSVLSRWKNADVERADLLRHIFGNPFRGNKCLNVFSIGLEGKK